MKRLIFSHIQKPGGLQFYSKIIENYGRENVLVVGSKKTGADIEPKELRRLNISQTYRLKCTKAIIGHLSLVECENSDNLMEWIEKEKPKVISILRNPMERVISLYKFINERTEHPLNESIKDISFQDFAFKMPNDIQTKWINNRFMNGQFVYVGNILLKPKLFRTENVTEEFGKYLIENNMISSYPGLKDRNQTIDKNNKEFENKIIAEYFKSGLDFKLVNSLIKRPLVK